MVAMMAPILNLGIIEAIKSLLITRKQFFAPKYPTLDTKIMALDGLVFEILGTIGFSGHDGSHLEFMNCAANGKYLNC